MKSTLVSTAILLSIFDGSSSSPVDHGSKSFDKRSLSQPLDSFGSAALSPQTGFGNPQLNQFPGGFNQFNQIPGQQYGQFPGQGFNQFNQVPGQQLGQFPGQGFNQFNQVPGQQFGQFPNQLNQVPGQQFGQFPGQGLNQVPGQQFGQFPNQLNQLPGQQFGQLPGQGLNQVPGQQFGTPGQGLTPPAMFQKSVGHSNEKAVQGHSKLEGIPNKSSNVAKRDVGIHNSKGHTKAYSQRHAA